MVRVQIKECPTRQDTSQFEDVHVFCYCSPGFGLCGEKLTGGKVDPEADTTCVVCYDLEYLPCERCGY